MKATRGAFISLTIVVLAVLWAGFGCSDADDSTTNSSDFNHTIALTNEGTNAVECTPRQFTYLELIPTDDTDEVVQYWYTSRPSTTMELDITLPKTGTYKVAFYVYENGPGVWWDSVSLVIDQTTFVTLYGNTVGYYDDSDLAGIRCDGSDITCN